MDNKSDESQLQKIMNSDTFYLFGVNFILDESKSMRYKTWVSNKKYNFEGVEFPFDIIIVNNHDHHLVEFKFVFSNLGNYMTLSKEIINDRIYLENDINDIINDIEKTIIIEFKNKIKNSVFESMVKNKEIEPIYELIKSLSKYTDIKPDEFMTFIYKNESFNRKIINL